MAVAAPPPRLTVSEWADNYRHLSSESSAEPGQWRTGRAEYQRGIMDAISEPEVTSVCVMTSAQVGKTEVINNIIGFHMDQDPAPMLLLQPTIQMAEAWSKDRLAPMIRDTRALSRLIELNNRRNSANTLLHKTFPGGHITMAGANSPASLASRPVRLVLCDEVDRYPASAGTEGDPVNLAKKRTNNFWNRRIVMVSTPTIKGVSRIEMEYEQSDKRRYFVPCAECGHEQYLQWSQVTWHKDEKGKALPETARYSCAECGVAWTDGDRIAAVEQGEWRATAEFSGRAGFHLNELYSPWVQLREIVQAFVEAKDNPETLKTWVNTSLGETWEDAGETVDEAGLMGRRELYPAEVPMGAVVLTMGVDVQGDRLEYEVVGWGHGEEQWGIETGALPGDPSLPAVWADLDNLLSKTWQHEGGGKFQIASTGIDTGGHHTQIVYDYCRQRAARRVFALKGIAGAGRPVVKVSRRGRGRAARAVDLYSVGVDDAKGTLYARLKATVPGGGYCHFPMQYDEEWFLQLTSEKQVTKFVRGFPRKEWVKTRARNEALDMRVYAYAAMKIINPVWQALAARVNTGKVKEKQPAKIEPQKEQPKEAPRPGRAGARRRKSSWASDI